MFQALKKNLITGLAILLPIAVTIALVGFLVNLFTAPFVDLVSSLLMRLDLPSMKFLNSEQFVRYFSKLLILILLFLFTVLLGFIMRWVLFNWILTLTDSLLKRIPVVNTIYKASQEIIKTFFKTDQTSFKQVVMVKFPHNGIYALGLVSKDSPKMCSDLTGSRMISVLIPTTPNPTSGFLLMVAHQDLIYLDMKPEAAIKYILSVGVIAPELEEKR